MKKILLYTDTPIVGGAEKHIHLLAKNLPKSDWQVVVACSHYKSLDNWCTEMENDGLSVIRLKVKHKHDPSHVGELKKIFQEQKPDIAHFHLWNPGAARYAFFALPKNIKLVTTEHDPFPLSGLKKIIKRKTLTRTDHTIVVSKDNSIKMLTWYPELENKLSIVHNGIDLQHFEKELLHFSHQEENKIRSQLFKAPPESFVIISIAALHPRKGLNYLIEAFEKVHKTKPNAYLVIVGEGTQQKDLLKQIKKAGLESRIIILSHQQDIAKILKSSDLFVLPSIKEAFGLVLLEAMAVGIPLIATNVGGIPEIIENGKNGILVEPANNEKMAEEILKLMDNQALRKKLAFVGSHEVRNFDLANMVKKTEIVYNKVLEE